MLEIEIKENQVKQLLDNLTKNDIELISNYKENHKIYVTRKLLKVNFRKLKKLLQANNMCS